MNLPSLSTMSARAEGKKSIAMHIPQPVKDLKHRLTGRL